MSPSAGGWGLAMVPQGSPEDRLVRAAGVGSVETFDGIAERSCNTGYAITCARLRHRESTESLAREASPRVFPSLGWLKDREMSSPWISQIVGNLTRDWHGIRLMYVVR